MDMSEQDKNRNEEQIHYNSPQLSSNWIFGGPNDLTTTASMVDSFCNTASTIWDHNATNSQTLGGLCDINQQNSSSSNGFRKSNLLVSPRNLDVSWVPPHSTMKMGDIYLSQFPSDSGFIERRCFGGGNFGDMITPYGNMAESSLSPYCNRAMPPFQGKLQEGSVGNGLKSVADEGSKAMPMSVDFVDHDESQLKNDGQSESFVRSVDEAKQGCVGFSGNGEPDEGNYSKDGGAFGQGETCNEGLVSKKRRRNGQDFDFDLVKGTTQVDSGDQQKGGNNPISVSNKRSGKHGSEASDMQKEEYIHVRARRGQATNSHSLAERVRREKISERMKFLQDLVPGCSKVTGKAVMLDEIINYVQSLQRQVEFLSMKLATVNPRMDFNIEGLLAKDNFQSRAGSSGTLGFGPHMTTPYPRKTISSQVPNTWDDELHNIMLIGLNHSTSVGSQDLGSTPPKDEL